MQKTQGVQWFAKGRDQLQCKNVCTTGDWNSAEASYKKALAQEPRNAALMCNYGAFLQDVRQDMSGAEKMFRNALISNPTHIEAMYNLGNLFWDVYRDERGAREQFEAVLKVDPNDVPTLCNLGQLTALSDESNNLKAAETYYVQGLAVNSAHVPTLFEYACLRARAGDDTKAQELLERALKTDAEHLPSLALRAEYLIAQGKQNEAEEQYRALLQRQGSRLAPDADFLCDYAQVVLKASKSYSKAEKLFRDALEQDDKHHSALCNYAKLLQQVKRDFPAAENMLQRVLKDQPDHVDALFHYGHLLWQVKGDVAGAEERYARAIAADPTHVDALCSYGALLATAKGQFDRAEKMYRQAVLLCVRVCPI